MTSRVSYNSLNLPSLDSVRGPRITSLTYPNGTAASTGGGDTVVINGSGFFAGCAVYIANTRSTVVTVVSRTQVTFLTPALAAATYILYLYNPDGATATYVPGISFSATPIWSTAAGSLGTVIETSSVSVSTLAVSAEILVEFGQFAARYQSQRHNWCGRRNSTGCARHYNLQFCGSSHRR